MAYKKTGKTASQVGEEIKSTITTKFLECLEKGCIPWKEQWNRSESGFLKSDGKSYSFMNTLLLAIDGCTEGEFVTLNGLAERLGIEPKEAWNHIKKGDNGKAVHGHHVYFYTMVPIYLKENGKVVYEKDARGQFVLDSKGKKIPKVSGHYPMLKSSVVWQVGTEAFCPMKFEKKKKEVHNNPISVAEQIILDYQAREGVKIEFLNATPAYSPSLDRIHVPTINDYPNANIYYSDLFHEIAHSSGHPKRLNRELANRMQRGSYSFEELIAEICSCAIMHDNGFDTPQCDELSQSYVKGWAKALKSDPSMVEKACRMAVKAANYIYNGEKK